jgi:hypothetical protein
VQRVDSGTVQQAQDGKQYRIALSGDNDADWIYNCVTVNREKPGFMVFEVMHDCGRFPAVCRGPRHWQIYKCVTGPDGYCRWVWQAEAAADCLFYEGPVTQGEHYRIHWGMPRDLEVTPSVTPRPHTPTPRPTGTPTSTSTDTPTPTATPTPAPRPVYLPSCRRGDADSGVNAQPAP